MERFFIYTNPLYWISLAIFFPVKWFLDGCNTIWVLYRNYRFYKSGIEKVDVNHLNEVVNRLKRKGFGSRLNRAIIYKSIQLLRKAHYSTE